jgi:hypothetical protein
LVYLILLKVHLEVLIKVLIVEVQFILPTQQLTFEIKSIYLVVALYSSHLYLLQLAHKFDILEGMNLKLSQLVIEALLAYFD